MSSWAQIVGSKENASRTQINQKETDKPSQKSGLNSDNQKNEEIELSPESDSESTINTPNIVFVTQYRTTLDTKIVPAAIKLPKKPVVRLVNFDLIIKDVQNLLINRTIEGETSFDVRNVQDIPGVYYRKKVLRKVMFHLLAERWLIEDEYGIYRINTKTSDE